MLTACLLIGLVLGHALVAAPTPRSDRMARKQPIVREVRDRFCMTCGSNVEFLALTGQVTVDADTKEPWLG